MEKISQVMQQNEVMKKGLRKLMLMFMLEWKTFEEESDLTTRCLQECFNELEVREKYLTSVQESVAEGSKELDLIRESLEQRRKEVETKEEEFCAFQEREIRDLECKWQDFIFAKKGFDEAVKLREEKLIKQEKIGERLLEEIGFEHKQLENFCKSSFTEICMKAKEFEELLEKLNKIQSLIRKESDVLQLKERKFAERMEEFQVKEIFLQSTEKELEIKVRSLDTVKKELREKEHYLDSIQKELREKETTLDSVKTKLTIKEDHLTSVKKELEDKDKGLDTIKKKLELREQDLNFFEEILQLREGGLNSIQEAYRQRSEDLDSREKKLDLVHGEFQLENEKFQTEQGFFKKKLKDIALKEKQFEVKFRELEQREKHMEDRFKVLEDKMKQLKTIGNVPEKTESIYLYNVEVERVGAISSSSADIKLVVTMDGRTLQIFLNEHANKLDSLSDDVFRSLQLSRNPAQLVLDAMEGFYPPHLMNGDTEFEGSVVKQTCILLLEQLIRVSPKIQPIVRRRARKLAREWKAKMRAMIGDQLEILGFLYLLASYGLVSSFDADGLMSLLTVVAEHNKSTELCRLLGFTEKIPCFIQNLIAKQKHLEAVEYAYAFELTGHFQPIPILKDYLKQVMQISECVCIGETYSVKEKNEAIEQSVASIRAVIRCIMDHELQSQYPPSQLEECIESLTRQKADVTASSVISEAQLKQVVSISPSVPTDTKALSSTSFSGTASTCMLGHSDAMAETAYEDCVIMEKISQVMQQNEVMKKGLRKLMLMFMLEWKTFEEESDLTTRCLQECFNELEVREKYLTSVQESVAEGSKELDLIRESLEQRRKEVETKEEEFCAFQEREIRDLECKWQDFIFAKKGFDEAVKLREEKLIKQEKIGERLLEEIGFEHKQLENFCKSSFTEICMKAKEFEELLEKLNKIQSLIRKESDVLQLKERKFAERMEEFQVKEIFLQSTEKELEIKVRSLDTVKKELREKEHYLDSIQKELREKETTLDSVKTKLTIKEDHLTSVKKELEDKDKGLDTIKKKLELREQDLNFFEEILQLREGGLNSIQEAYRQRSEDLDSREKKLDLVHGEFQLENEKFQTEQGFFKKKLKDIALKEKQFEVKFRELEQREKHMEDRFKVLEDKMKQLKTIGNVPEKTESIYLYNVEVERVGAISSSSADIKLVVTMDGRTLQIFLNEHANKLDSLSDDVFRSLQLSRNPAQLVLDAMEGFYPPHLMNGDTEFEGSVVKQTCILLLEQLIRVSPKIQPIVRRRARKLAREWKAKMRAMIGDQLEILGFLYLLASYGLVSSFDADGLMSLLTVVAEHNKSTELCRLLGFTEKIPCFIQNLIAKQKHLEAVEYAYAFELTGHFQPIPILKDYLKQVMQISECVCIGETYSVKEKNEAIEQSVASIRAVIRCIMDHELQSQYPPSQLEECIESLTRQKADVTASSVISEAQLKQVVSISPSVPTDTKALSSTSFSGTASTCMLGHSDAMAAILVSMGGKNLQNFLYNHWNEQELLRIEISRALKMSCDSGLLVLEALEGFYPPEPHNEEILFDRSVIRKSCILLLEQLMRLSPEIKPKAKLEARKLAFDWKAKMIAETENYLAILGFLLLVGAYGLASSFDKYELESLCHTVAQDENAYQNFHVLGIAGENPQIEKSMDPSKTEPLCDNVELKSKARDLTSACSLSFIHCASDPAKVVLDALRKCRSANLGKCKYGPSSLMKRFSDLLEHLREVSPEITTQVKIEAIVLAVEWRETLTGSQLNHSEVIGFLQLLATFELSTSYDSDELLGLLEIVYQSRRAINLFKILGLADKIPGFIENLIRRKQWLLAIRYIYVYELVDLFPPVPLLKDFVLYSEELAKKIHDNGLGSREAQEKAINCEISALRAAVKRILWHNLQSEYSPDHLRARIAKLRRQMADLRIPNQHCSFTTKSQVDDRDEGTLCAPISQVQKAVMKKRLASATEGVIVHESQQQRKLKRVCQLPERTEVGPDAIICNASLSSSVQSSSQPTSADDQISTATPNYSEKLFSQRLEGCPEDDQICDSGQASSQLFGDSHAYDDTEVETEVPVQINPVYHSGQNLVPKLQELLSKLKNSLSSSGKTEDHERTQREVKRDKKS